MRDPDPPRLWRIADFSSLRLVINIEFFLREKSERNEREPRSTLRGAPRTCSRWCSRRSGTLSCVGGLKGPSMLVGHVEEVRAQIFQPRCADHCPLFATRPTFFPHHAPYVPTGLTRRFCRRNRKFAR